MDYAIGSLDISRHNFGFVALVRDADHAIFFLNFNSLTTNSSNLSALDIFGWHLNINQNNAFVTLWSLELLTSTGKMCLNKIALAWSSVKLSRTPGGISAKASSVGAKTVTPSRFCQSQGLHYRYYLI